MSNVYAQPAFNGRAYLEALELNVPQLAQVAQEPLYSRMGKYLAVSAGTATVAILASLGPQEILQKNEFYDDLQTYSVERDDAARSLYEAAGAANQTDEDFARLPIALGSQDCLAAIEPYVGGGEQADLPNVEAAIAVWRSDECGETPADAEDRLNIARVTVNMQSIARDRVEIGEAKLQAVEAERPTMGPLDKSDLAARAVVPVISALFMYSVARGANLFVPSDKTRARWGARQQVNVAMKEAQLSFGQRAKVRLSMRRFIADELAD